MSKLWKLTPAGKIIKKRLVDMDQTSAWLAAQLGVSRALISSILSGQKSGKKYMDKICELLGLDPEVLRKAG